MKYLCPKCGSDLHLNYLGDNITDAYCLYCNNKIELNKIKQK